MVLTDDVIKIVDDVIASDDVTGVIKQIQDGDFIAADILTQNNNKDGSISKPNQARVNEAVKTAKAVVDAIAANNKKITDAAKEAAKAGEAAAGAVKSVGPIMGAIGKLAPFLGVASAFISVIMAFLPKQDSRELKAIKAGFAEVNRKLDTITLKIDSLNSLIPMAAQKVGFIYSTVCYL